MRDIRVVGDGVTVTNLEYYAEAEPRLLQLRDMYREKKITKDEVIDAVRKMVGFRRVELDMEGMGEAGTVKQIKSFLDFQRENPLRPRLYGKPGVVAALILAPPDAKEVKYEYQVGH